MEHHQEFEFISQLTAHIVAVQRIFDAADEGNRQSLGPLAPPRQVIAESRISVRTELIIERSSALSITLRPLGLSGELRHQRRAARRVDLLINVIQQPLADRPFSQSGPIP